MRYVKKVYCERCCGEIYTGEKFYETDEGTLCRECFLEKEREYLELNTDDFAELVGVSVIVR